MYSYNDVKPKAKYRKGALVTYDYYPDFVFKVAKKRYMHFVGNGWYYDLIKVGETELQPEFRGCREKSINKYTK